MYNKNGSSPDTLQDYQRPTNSTAQNEERLKPSQIYKHDKVSPMNATATITPAGYSDGRNIARNLDSVTSGNATNNSGFNKNSAPRRAVNAQKHVNNQRKMSIRG